jgi:hypothetical protein
MIRKKSVLSAVDAIAMRPSRWQHSEFQTSLWSSGA